MHRYNVYHIIFQNYRGPNVYFVLLCVYSEHKVTHEVGFSFLLFFVRA